MSEAVLVCDPEDRVQIVNRAADRLFAGRPVRDRADLLSRFEPLTGDPAREEPLTLRARDLPNRWFELRVFGVGRQQDEVDRQRGGRILVLRDVTEARVARAERRAFLAILSHELRTPITTIYAGSRVLARHGSKPPAGSEIAADISAEAARLYDVVEDLLVLTRVEQGLLDLSLEPVLLQRIVETSVRLAGRRTPSVPIIRTGIPDPPAVRGDPVYIEQVVRNLVTAAAQYAGPGVPLVIHLDAGESEVRLSILDKGPDLRPRDAERLFDLVDESPGVRQRAGIGPFVCRRIVESMDGRIWATPRENGGAEIGFALPRFDDTVEEALTA
jgi:K+-sensing histidine kinase KdpD